MIIGPRINADRFDYQQDSKTFVEEISTLSSGKPVKLWGQLFDDACDLGFVLVSPRTGKEIPFYLSSTDQDCDGDVTGWNFKPVDSSIPFSVLIIND